MCRVRIVCRTLRNVALPTSSVPVLGLVHTMLPATQLEEVVGGGTILASSVPRLQACRSSMHLLDSDPAQGERGSGWPSLTGEGFHDIAQMGIMLWPHGLGLE